MGSLGLRLLHIALLVLLSSAQPVWAHESRPLAVEIAEYGPDHFMVSVRVPPSVPHFNQPRITLPGSCERVAREDAGSPHGLYRCPDGIAGREISVAFPRFNPSISTLIRLRWHSGEKRSVVLGPDETSWRVPAQATTLSTIRQYGALGFEHILSGYDHLLFLVCLMLLARTWRRIVVAVTGFTLGHSVTLALGALDVVRAPVGPVESCVALSIVFLAAELARGRRDTLTYRKPIVVSTAFGFLHGLAFAAVLREIGLPQTEVPAALLAFNLGVEAGQVAFIAVLMASGALLLQALRRLGRGGSLQNAHVAAQLCTVYLVGTLALMWTLERATGS